MRIVGGRVLAGGSMVEAALDIDDGHIAGVGQETAPGRCLDASGLNVLPGSRTASEAET
jgi:dihydroorotase-like cyclic amidohydrolase